MDLDVPSKRVLTDEIRDASQVSDNFARSASSGTPEDLIQRLRNAGARGRKSVLEGYKTTPSTFSKAQSTGSIFTSMNDTLHKIYSNRDSLPSLPSNDQVSRKRARSVMEHDVEIATPEGSEAYPAFGQPVTFRPVKSLPNSRRSLHTTHSLPTSSFTLGGNGQTSQTQSFPQSSNEEEDWSQDTTFQSSEQKFEPMVL
ncbi:hypothetical protein JR316_0004736 [Psilocybe cubensis]|uniref:Uncharacterized protein n=2 Tax=Psilocybe cubensis TaxID=181762 RepID=A0ACB8H568_PSICU|nr:hypothetical protein JR316_0004736 [Psilocybe cubensis]KAH9482636.1 hypothetical protein JR316_0004736 [Psilocybe cubensis]